MKRVSKEQKMVVMVHQDATGCSWGGESFARRADGTFVVPEEAVDALRSHGYVLLPESRKADR